MGKKKYWGYYSMSKLMLLEIDFENRISELTDYIIEILKPTKNDEVYILDPYFNVEFCCNSLLNENLSDPWFWIIEELNYHNIKKIDFVTSQSFKTFITNEYTKINAHFYDKYKKNNFRYDYKNTILNFIYYTEAHSPYPDNPDLHDRWLILTDKSSKNIGLHLGPSISDIENKDLTITIFDNRTIFDAIKRFNQIKNIGIMSSSW